MSKVREIGIDLARSIAAFGVVAIHAGISVDNRTASSAHAVKFFFAFAVPFFLGTSFYFSLQPQTTPSWSEWMKKYSSRLLVPYLLWAVIYFLLRLVRYPDKFFDMLSDPVGLLLFSGGGGLALYFLPLLFFGLIISKILKPYLNLFSARIVFFCYVLSLVILDLLMRTKNIYDLGTGHAFLALVPNQDIAGVRIGLKFISDFFFCIPHILAANLILRMRNARANYSILIISALVLIFGQIFVGNISSIHHVRGDCFLIVAVLCGNWLHKFKDTVIVSFAVFASACSFGIFLSHQIFLQVLQVIVRKFGSADLEMGVGLLFTQTAFVFLLICGVIHVTQKNRLSQIVFALK